MAQPTTWKAAGSHTLVKEVCIRAALGFLWGKKGGHHIIPDWAEIKACRVRG
jgi:hypothetical protein